MDITPYLSSFDYHPDIAVRIRPLRVIVIYKVKSGTGPKAGVIAHSDCRGIPARLGRKLSDQKSERQSCITPAVTSNKSSFQCTSSS